MWAMRRRPKAVQLRRLAADQKQPLFKRAIITIIFTTVRVVHAEHSFNAAPQAFHAHYSALADFRDWVGVRGPLFNRCGLFTQSLNVLPLLQWLRPCAVHGDFCQVDTGVFLDELGDALRLDANATV